MRRDSMEFPDRNPASPAPSHRDNGENPVARGFGAERTEKRLVDPNLMDKRLAVVLKPGHELGTRRGLGILGLHGLGGHLETRCQGIAGGRVPLVRQG